MPSLKKSEAACLNLNKIEVRFWLHKTDRFLLTLLNVHQQKHDTSLNRRQIKKMRQEIGSHPPDIYKTSKNTCAIQEGSKVHPGEGVQTPKSISKKCTTKGEGVQTPKSISKRCTIKWTGVGGRTTVKVQAVLAMSLWQVFLSFLSHAFHFCCFSFSQKWGFRGRGVAGHKSGGSGAEV